MNTAEIIVICIILSILVFIAFTYLIHGRKLTKKEKKEKEPKKEVVTAEEKQLEQKPIPVGIIREEIKQEKVKEDYDLAPLREQPKAEESQVSNDNKTKSLKQEIKNLSPEMKKVIMSDILKPRF